MRKFTIIGLIVLLGVLGCSTVPELEPGGSTTPDTTAPTVLISAPVSGSKVGGIYTLQGVAVDAGSGVDKVYYKTDDGTYAEAPLNNDIFQANISLSNYGIHTNYVYAVDKAGNTSSIQSVNIERAGVPSVVIGSPVNGCFTNIFAFPVTIAASVDAPTLLTEMILEVRGNDDLIKYKTTNSLSGRIASESIVAQNLTLGTNTINVIVKTDNLLEATTFIKVFVETGTPVITADYSNDIFTNEAFTVTFDVSENYGYWSTNSIPFVQFDTNGTSILISGDVILKYYANDGAGNTTPMQTVVYKVNTSSPLVVVNPGTHLFDQSFVASLSVNRDHGYWSTNGVSSFIELYTNGTNISIDDTTTLYCYGYDGTNTSSTQTIVYTYDATAPAVNIIPAGDITTNEAFTVSLSVGENYGYWSTNGIAFVQVDTGGIIFNISGDTVLKYYGSDGLNTSSTQTVNYLFDYGNIYVSINGNNLNDGIAPFKAVLSVQKAIDLAQATGYTNIYVEEGTYRPGVGLAHSVADNNYAGVNISNVNNINLVGGWDSDFTVRAGYSTLTAINGNFEINKHIIWVEDLTNLMIDGFVIQDGIANGSYPHNRGGGIYFKYVLYTLVTNCIISDNTANGDGGGVYMNNSSHNSINGTILNNFADSTADYGGGGGVYTIDSSYNLISGIISDNTASGSISVGGGVNIKNGTSNIISGIISNNTTGSEEGGGVFITGGSHNFISGTLVDNNGGGVLVKVSSYNTISGTIINNNGSGGVCLYTGNYNIISGTILGNIVNAVVRSGGGGVYISGDYNTISGNISSNTAGDRGGGVYIYGGWYNNISATISGNSANQNGGGVCMSGSYNTNTGSIVSNTAGSGYKGGGVYIYSGSVNNFFGPASVIRWNTVTDGSVGDGGGVYNDNAAGTQFTNSTTVISDNSPDDWADKP